MDWIIWNNFLLNKCDDSYHDAVAFAKTHPDYKLVRTPNASRVKRKVKKAKKK